MSSTPAGYVYHFPPHAEPQPISLSLSEDNLTSYLDRRGTWLIRGCILKTNGREVWTSRNGGEGDGEYV